MTSLSLVWGIFMIFFSKKNFSIRNKKFVFNKMKNFVFVQINNKNKNYFKIFIMVTKIDKNYELI